MRKIDLEAERSFENRKAMGEKIRANQSKFYWATFLYTQEHNKKTFQLIRNKKVLEIGCSEGNDAKQYSLYAKNYTGIDISDEAIKNAKALGLPNAEFLCVDGHEIPKPDNSYDCIITRAVLHHLDLEITFKEISRLLKKDGILVFSEPLGTNPIFQIYRKFTPYARTDDERPFTFSDIKLMSSYFELKDVQWFGFFNIFSAFVKTSFVRYSLSKVDHLFSLTPIRYFFWQFSGFAKLKNFK